MSDINILKSFKNQSPNHKHTIIAPEFTFYGYPKQPDGANVIIEIVPGKRVIELKSFKEYLVSFRSDHISYEKVLNVIYNDIKKKLHPKSLYIKIETKPRGGISSVLEKGKKAI